MSKEAYNSGVDVVVTLKTESNLDYSSKEEEIIKFFDEVLFEGNWDSTLEFEDGTPSLRFIQEDEYDQHMDEDEDKPDQDDSVYAGGHYVFVQ